MLRREEQRLTNTHQRDPYWDLVKALLILLVIWGHCIQVIQLPAKGGTMPFWDSPFFNGIYLFHMPLFIGISGYFAAASIRRHGKDALRRYSIRLLIPNLTFGLLHIVVEWVRLGTTGNPWHRLMPLWFLIVIFECTGLYYLLRHFTSVLLKPLLFLIPPLIVAAFDAVYPRVFPFAEQFTYLWPFFLTFAWLNERGITAAHFRKWHIVFLLPLIPLSLYLPKEFSVYNTPFGFTLTAAMYDLVRTLIAAALCIGFLGLAQHLHPWAHWRLTQLTARATLAIYALHILIVDAYRILIPGTISQLSDTATFALALVLLVFLDGVYVLIHRFHLLPLLLFGERK